MVKAGLYFILAVLYISLSGDTILNAQIDNRCVNNIIPATMPVLYYEVVSDS